MGRATAADVRLVDPSVSRLHARIEWPRGRSRPIIEDLGSANGVWIDGTRIAGLAELKDGMQLSIGVFSLVVGLVDDAAPALLDDDDGDSPDVRLYSESGPELTGEVASPEHIRDLLLDLEQRARTGTLELAGGRAVVFARGLVVHARTSGSTGAAALAEILVSGPGIYRFRREVTARESRLSLSIRALLEDRATDTQRCPKLQA